MRDISTSNFPCACCNSRKKAWLAGLIKCLFNLYHRCMYLPLVYAFRFFSKRTGSGVGFVSNICRSFSLSIQVTFLFLMRRISIHFYSRPLLSLPRSLFGPPPTPACSMVRICRPFWLCLLMIIHWFLLIQVGHCKEAETQHEWHPSVRAYLFDNKYKC